MSSFDIRRELDSLMKRSKKNNLWCQWDGYVCTVFHHAPSDAYRYSIAGRGDVEFSKHDYIDEDDATQALAERLSSMPRLPEYLRTDI